MKQPYRIFKKNNNNHLDLELNSDEKKQFIQHLYNYTLSINPRKGLLAEEVCLLVKETKCPILNKINELNSIPKQNKQDFIVTPILKNNHFISAVVYFLNNEPNLPTDRQIYIFDSHQQNTTPFLTQQDGINECLLLNMENLQGNSNSCGYFTIEFIKEASKCRNFIELYTKCQNHEMQKIIYQKVKKLFKDHKQNLDNLIGTNHSEILDKNGFGTANNQHLYHSSAKDIIINKIKLRQQKATFSFVERYKKARDKKEIEKNNSIYYYGK